MKFKKFRNTKEYLIATKLQILDENGNEYDGPPMALDDMEVISHAWNLMEEGTLVVRIKNKRRR
jgi:hypothetical protein